MKLTNGLGVCSGSGRYGCSVGQFCWLSSSPCIQSSYPSQTLSFGMQRSFGQANSVGWQCGVLSVCEESILIIDVGGNWRSFHGVNTVHLTLVGKF